MATVHDLAASVVGSHATELTLIAVVVAVAGLALTLAPSLA